MNKTKESIGLKLMLCSMLLGMNTPLVAQLSGDEINTMSLTRDWIFYVFIFVFLLIGILRVFFAKSYLDGFKSFNNFNVAHQNFKTQNLKLFFADIGLVLIFILLFSLLIFKHLDNVNDWSAAIEPTWYVVICLISIIGLGLKLFANKILTEILPFKENLHFSNYMFWSGIKMFGIILIPITLLVVYNPFISMDSRAIYLLLIGSILFYIIYIMHLFRIGKDYIYKSNLHFFLYICAFEIAPLFVILKFSFLIINKLQQIFV